MATTLQGIKSSVTRWNNENQKLIKEAKRLMQSEDRESPEFLEKYNKLVLKSKLQQVKKAEIALKAEEAGFVLKLT